MITFILALIPVALAIWCIHILFQDNHILEKPGKFITEKLGEYWSKPVINCPICMSSVWGTIGFFALDWIFGVHLPWRHFIPFIFSLCGLNTIISKLTSKERIIVDE